jgi:DNA repair protein RecO (recombination protein O)
VEWVDDGVVIGIRSHGETGVIAELLTREHGRHAGFVHGGRSRRLRPVLQPGNDVRVTWKGRGEDLLGTFTLEPLALRAARAMEAALALQGVNLICALARLLPEREPHPALHAVATALLDRIGDAGATPAEVVRFELMLLVELGYGLDLSCCAVTGTTEDLAYVSPRSGRAVTRAAGDPYRDRVFALPAFLASPGSGAGITTPDIVAGFGLTAHFLRREVLAPRGLALPDCRAAYIRALEAARP